MKIIAPFIVVLTIGFSCMYFTSQPSQASEEVKSSSEFLEMKALYDEMKGRYLSQEKVLLKVKFRLETLEYNTKTKVPAELAITVNHEN